jgi:hypothetical protein
MVGLHEILNRLAKGRYENGVFMSHGLIREWATGSQTLLTKTIGCHVQIEDLKNIFI